MRVTAWLTDAYLSIAQNKTGKKLRWAIEGDLANIITQLMSKPRNEVNLVLLQGLSGQHLTYFAMCSRFDKAREIADINFQFRDLHVKAATETEDLAHAQNFLTTRIAVQPEFTHERGAAN
jgi:hypothetical protein